MLVVLTAALEALLHVGGLGAPFLEFVRVEYVFHHFLYTRRRVSYTTYEMSSRRT